MRELVAIAIHCNRVGEIVIRNNEQDDFISNAVCKHYLTGEHTFPQLSWSLVTYRLHQRWPAFAILHFASSCCSRQCVYLFTYKVTRGSYGTY